MDYQENSWENPPVPVAADPPKYDSMMHSEEFEDAARKKDKPKRETMSFSKALMASKMEKTGKLEFTVSSLTEVGIYACFLIILVIIAFYKHGVETYYYTSIMQNLFVAREGATSQQAFTDVATLDDIWDYLDQVLLTGLYSTDANATSEDAMVYDDNKLLGEPRIRMLKVTNTSCTVIQSFSREIDQCYATYAVDKEDRDTFGSADSTAYIYQTAETLQNDDLVGTISTYGGGGFVLYLPIDDSTTAQALIADLKSNRWLDRGSRAVIIDFAMYNANLNLFCVIKLLFELPASGGVIPNPKIYTMDLFKYNMAGGTFLIAMEGLLTGFVCFFIFEELLEIVQVRMRYFFEFWNIIEFIIISLGVVSLILSYKSTHTSTKRLNKILDNELTVAAFDDVIGAQTWYLNIFALLLFFAWIKVFKYISVNKTMAQLSATLIRSSKDIGGFAVMFAVFFFAFAQFGYLIADYSTFYDAVFALLRLILGDFNFSSMESTNRILGPVFFISYVFFVYFILLNMFLAIINDAYVEVKQELARTNGGTGVLDWIMFKMRKMMKHGKKPDGPGNTDVTYEDYKTELMRAGYNEQDINEAFTKFDLQYSEPANVNVLEELGGAVEDQSERRKIYTENHMDFVNLLRRVNTMEESIILVTDRMDEVNSKIRSMEVAEVENMEKMIQESDQVLRQRR